MPSRYLQEIPAELIDWRQSPGMANSRGGTQPRALNAARGRGGGYGGSRLGSGSERLPAELPPAPKPKTEWANRITAQVRDNGDLDARSRATASGTSTSARAA